MEHAALYRPIRPIRWRLGAPLYVLALATATFFAFSRCTPDFQPAPAYGAEIPPAFWDQLAKDLHDLRYGGCEPPREPLYDTDGYYYGCGIPPAPEPRPAPERRDHASPY